MSETNEFELCVLCGVETDVKKNTHVEERDWFVTGVWVALSEMCGGWVTKELDELLIFLNIIYSKKYL